MPSDSPRSALVVTQHFWPEEIGSAPYCTDIAERLAAEMARVQVLTCRPNYPQGRVPPAYDNGQNDTQLYLGAEVERVAPYLPKKRDTAGRLIQEFAFFVRGLWAFASGRVRRHEVVVSFCPSVVSVLLGAVLVRRHGVHFAIVHDIQSGLAEGLGMVGDGIVLRIMRRAERYALGRADVLFVLSHDMRRYLLRLGVRRPIQILPIWVNTRAIRPLDRPGTANPTVLYSGNFGRKQSLSQVVDMAEQLERRGIDIDITLRGEGSERNTLARDIADRGLGNVRLAPLMPADRLAEALASGDIHLVPQDAKTASFAVPSKLFAIMAAGRPCVACAHKDSLLWRLADRSRAFICVESGDSLALADAVQRLASDPGLRDELGKHGRNYASKVHERSVILDKFVDIVRQSWRIKTQLRPHVLIFEPDPRGHAPEWIEYVIAAAKRRTDLSEVTFVLSRELIERCKEAIDRPGSSPRSPQLNFVALSRGAQAGCLHRNVVVSAMYRYCAMWRHLKREGADHGVFTCLDHLSLPLAMRLPMPKPVSGVLFRPSVHYREIAPGVAMPREKWRERRKEALYRSMLQNPCLGGVLSLDPYFPDYADRHYPNGGKVTWIPDPAPRVRERGTATVVPFGAPAIGRILFVMFGEIAERKGVFALLEALRRIGADTAALMSVEIAGPIDPKIRSAVLESVERLRADNPALEIEVADRRLSKRELATLLRRAAVILAPYGRFVGSSGVLLWAARLRRPVICQSYGLMGRLVREHRLGRSVDTSNPDLLAGALDDAVRYGPKILGADDAAMARLAAQNSPEEFGNGILDCAGTAAAAVPAGPAVGRRAVAK